mgnify:CR=1 FL=1
MVDNKWIKKLSESSLRLLPRLPGGLLLRKFERHVELYDDFRVGRILVGDDPTAYRSRSLAEPGNESVSRGQLQSSGGMSNSKMLRTISLNKFDIIS